MLFRSKVTLGNASGDFQKKIIEALPVGGLINFNESHFIRRHGAHVVRLKGRFVGIGGAGRGALSW